MQTVKEPASVFSSTQSSATLGENREPNEAPSYPFAAIVGQDNMKLGLILNVINSSLSGILIRGEKGTAKSTAVRSLAEILPKIEVVTGCPFQCDPGDVDRLCPFCQEMWADTKDLPSEKRKVRVVELPISATEDRVIGTLDLEHALKAGEKKIEPGILAAAHRGILYVDEVNLLDDHVVDVLLDSAAMGVNTIEREGISFSHPARFTLVGTMNPEEGELRPQLLDRFGLCVQIEGLQDPGDRMEIIRRRSSFETNPEAFQQEWRQASAALSEIIDLAKTTYPEVKENESNLYDIVHRSVEVGVDGHRSDIVMLKAAKTLAAYDGRMVLNESDLNKAAELALLHRIRRQPFEEIVVP
jgi:magnesium chelatase subunit I